MIKENIHAIRQRIIKVCSGVNQDPDKITIVAVSKGRAPEELKEAIGSGIADIGESRVQEAQLKYSGLKTPGAKLTAVRWHMVGHLQTNKAREALKIFDLIQSVDSVHLAQAIDKEAAKINKVQDILIEVNTSAEEQKFGLKPKEAPKAMKEISGFKNISVKGLMTIAPLTDEPGEARPYFRILRELRDEIDSFGIWRPGFGILSMGMTDDFEVAIEEGSNMVRLGRAIFEG